VEAAGVEPASENSPQRRLHTYSGIYISLVKTRPNSLSDKPTCLRFRQNRNRWPGLTIPLVDALAGFAGETRQDGSSSKRLRHMHNHLRLCLVPPFNEQAETSVCSRCFDIPVEAVTPPNFERTNRALVFDDRNRVFG